MAICGARAEGANNVLVLERINEESERVKVAQLVRSEKTRTPGSRASSAGNGGRLEICLYGNGEGEGEGRIMDEVTIVSTCLVMLKREVDRRRALQIMMISCDFWGCCLT